MYRAIVATPAFEPFAIPLWIWQREDVRAALRRRDIGAVLVTVLRHAGASQGRLAVATGLAQGRVSEVMRGTRTVTALDVFERIAAGLGIPDDARMLLGLAPVTPAGLDHLGPSGRRWRRCTAPSTTRSATSERPCARRVRSRCSPSAGSASSA